MHSIVFKYSPLPQSDRIFNHPFLKEVNVFVPERFILKDN